MSVSEQRDGGSVLTVASQPRTDAWVCHDRGITSKDRLLGEVHFPWRWRCIAPARWAAVGNVPGDQVRNEGPGFGRKLHLYDWVVAHLVE